MRSSAAERGVVFYGKPKNQADRHCRGIRFKHSHRIQCHSWKDKESIRGNGKARAGTFGKAAVYPQHGRGAAGTKRFKVEGMVLIGFCQQDYCRLREKMHIPFVIYDGCIESAGNFVNIEADHFGDGVQAGQYLRNKGHKNVLCISDNAVCMDKERFLGLKSQLPDAELMMIPMEENRRISFYKEHIKEILKYTAVFAVSDHYAMDFIRFARSMDIPVPEEISVMGFDEVKESGRFFPPLTTIRQDPEKRAALALGILMWLRAGESFDKRIKLPVSLIERASVRSV